MKIGIGSDHNAYNLKEYINTRLLDAGHEIVDFGCYSKDTVDYPEVAAQVSHAILEKKIEKGILFCGTGIGMAMAANKIKGIRAAQVHDMYSAQRAELSNNAHIITIGSKVVGEALAGELVLEFLSQKYVDSPSGEKIKQVMNLDE